MRPEDWTTPWVRSLAVRLTANTGEASEQDGRERGDTFLLLLNAHKDTVVFGPPVDQPESEWEMLLDTATWPQVDASLLTGGALREVIGRSLVLLRLRQRHVGPATDDIDDAEPS